MDKSKMKAIRKQVRSTDLDNASQMNKVDGRIYERNPDNDQIRSRKKGDYGNETIEGNIDEVMDKVIHPVRKRIREEVLDELWAANKLNHEGHWYIRLSDTIKIIQGEI
jgi:hypothetical protein